MSRRQFLLASGGGAAAIWVGFSPVAQGRQSDAIVGAPLAQLDPPVLRALPFAEEFVNPALPQWNVRRAVSIVGSSPFGATYPATANLDRAEFLRGRGGVLDLDGPVGASTGPGLIETVDSFIFESGATYELRFTVAGSHRSGDSIPLSRMNVSLPGLSESKDVARMPQDEFLEFTHRFDVSQLAISTIVVASGDAPGQAGVLLESVALSRIG